MYCNDLTPKPGDTISVWFSRGAASAVAAKETIRMYGDICTIRILTNPIKEEDQDNDRFMADVENWIGQEIELVTNKKYPAASAVDVWDKRKFMSAPHGAPCTFHLKKEARHQWEALNSSDWIVLGFTADESKRLKDFRLTERENALGVLVDQGITKGDCFRYLLEAGIQAPRVYEMGYPNANCIGCVKATSPT